MNSTVSSICFINPSTAWKTIGGAEVQIRLLAEEALRRGLKVMYVTRPDQIPDAEETDSGIKFHPFSETGDPKKDLASFTRLLTEIDADIYYQRGRKLWTWFTGEFSVRSGKPFIYAASMDLDCRRRKFLFRRSGSWYAHWKNIRNLSSDYRLDHRTLQGIRNASLVLSQTETQKKLFLKNLGIRSSVFTNLHPIPPPDSFQKDSPPVVLWLASVKRWKQPGLFLQLARDLRHLDCRFVLAGRLADREFEPILEQAERDLEHFSWIRDVPFERSNDLMGRASLFVNTSRMEEGFPNTYIQSWLRNTPTVTLHFDPDGIIERENIGASAGGEYRNLQEHVSGFIQDRERRLYAGESARKYARVSHGLEENMDRFITLISSL
ncbi:MAG: glycosyltransferase family 4 protein [Balneolaceae bacterium]